MNKNSVYLNQLINPLSVNTRSRKYILKALQIFKQEGLRLSLDELAEKMAISKKTLYNHFDSKEELHSRCMQTLFDEMNQKAAALTTPSNNAIDCMREAFSGLNAVFQQLSPLFINDMQRMYPNSVNSSHATDIDDFQHKIRENIEKGIKEGVYYPQSDVAFISHYIIQSMFGFYFHSVVNQTDFLTSTYFETVLDFTLRGLVSDRGRLLL